MSSSSSTFDIQRYVSVCDFAARKHCNQRRKGDESPYINHPLGVANILSSEANVCCQLTLEAAVLHDTVEDTDTSFEEIETLYGKRLADVVREVTDDKSLNKEQRKRGQIEHAAHVSEAAKLVKLADKLYNFRDLQRRPPKGWDALRIQGYFVWGRAVVSALAGVNQSLDDALQRLFDDGHFAVDGTRHRTTPDNVDLDQFLEDYLVSMCPLND
jgi:guanosine-3',5'-bis(diphosphate) 3'-pyrophosphohydrolase